MKKAANVLVSIVASALVLTAVSCSKKEAAAPAAAPAEAAPAAAESQAAAPAAAEIPAAALKNINGAYISANDLTVGALTTSFKDEASGFTLNATEEKAMAVEQPQEPAVLGNEVFAQRVSTKGSGNTTLRNITFTAKKDDSIIIYCAQGGSSNRPLHVAAVADGSEVAELSMDPKGSQMNVFEVTAPADGDYCVYSTTGGCYIYQIKVGKAN